MRQILTGFLLLLCLLSMQAQSAEDRYASRMTQDGVIYFIMPQKLNQVSGIKRFEYDITLLNWSETATINFTFESTSMLVPENLEIKVGNEVLKCNSYSPLFIDIKKNHYIIRITSQFSVKDIECIFNSDVPPVFNFKQNNQIESATYTKKAWLKDRKKLKDIFTLYQYSK